ncbi:hypothetical protein LCGC14_1477150 [marine sediment metagenome]|uniref:Uncharacterized protein n=1 Tax=marine sediment metagenome TaxID=412755 RepID=A0A0F9MCD5_9ZZZZ
MTKTSETDELKQADQTGYYRGVDWATEISAKTLEKVLQAHQVQIETLAQAVIDYLDALLGFDYSGIRTQEIKKLSTIKPS